MPAKLHAADYLAAPGDHPPAPVCVAFGDDAFLKRQVLGSLRREACGGDEGDFSLAAFEGGSADWQDVLDELSTVAMFGGGRRVAVVDEADPFVTRHRAELEDYVARPRSTGILILEVKSFPANTRLYKAVAAAGLAVDCSAPVAGKLTKFLTTWAKRVHGASLSSAAAGQLVEMVGPELGLLDQELAKLSLSAGPGGKITPETVSRMVGTWRAKTTWEMLDAALEGRVADAMIELDRLLLAGENPIGLLAQISASLRRLAAATRLVLQAEAAGQRPNLRSALEQAGVRSFVLRKTEAQLRKVGRQRGAQLYDWLLEADLGLKGSSALPPRLILERLIVRLAAPSARQASAATR